MSTVRYVTPTIYHNFGDIHVTYVPRASGDEGFYLQGGA